MIKGLKSKIYIDSGNAADTLEALQILGFLDGQTTNPSLFAKEQTVDITSDELWEKYSNVLKEIRTILPTQSISAEVYVDTASNVNNIMNSAQRLIDLNLNLHIKIPIFKAGIVAMTKILESKNKVNMTLGFDQNQAFAVAKNAHNIESDQLYFSSFVGRNIDNGINGIDQTYQIQKMFKEMNSKVKLLACSFRNLDQFMACLAMEVDIVTVNISILREWKKQKFVIPSYDSFHFEGKKIKYIQLDHLEEDKINNILTTQGIVKFSNDWNSVIL